MKVLATELQGICLIKFDSSVQPNIIPQVWIFIQTKPDIFFLSATRGHCQIS